MCCEVYNRFWMIFPWKSNWPKPQNINNKYECAHFWLGIMLSVCSQTVNRLYTPNANATKFLSDHFLLGWWKRAWTIQNIYEWSNSFPRFFLFIWNEILANYLCKSNTYPALTSIKCNKFSKITFYVLLHHESRHYTYSMV